MDLSDFSLREILQSALKSEVDSREVYLKLAERVDNYVLKDRLNFLADEEKKHRKFIQSFYNKKFPGEEVELPEETPVPLPKVDVEDEGSKLRDLLYQAMQAEKATQDFYNDLSDYYQEEKSVKDMLKYLASMEMSHYYILKAERDNIDMFEEYGTDWPFIHIGP